MKICEVCGKEHDGSYGSGRFCSKHCRMSYIAQQSIEKRRQNGTLNELMAKARTKIKKHHRTPAINLQPGGKCKFCGRECKNRNSLINHESCCKENPNKTQLNISRHRKSHRAWNKGLTKETDARIAKGTSTLKEGYASGRLIPSQTGRHHTLETRKQMSEKKIYMYSVGILPSKVKGVKFYRERNLNGIEYAIQGTWELAVARKLNAMNILWEKGFSIKYVKEDGSIHQYLPDFYLPVTNEYIEVKGFFTDLDKTKMRYVLEQNSISLFFIGSDKYQNFIDGKISLQECTSIPW